MRKFSFSTFPLSFFSDFLRPTVTPTLNSQVVKTLISEMSFPLSSNVCESLKSGKAEIFKNKVVIIFTFAIASRFVMFMPLHAVMIKEIRKAGKLNEADEQQQVVVVKETYNNKSVFIALYFSKQTE